MRDEQGNGVRIPNCPAAVSSFIASGSVPLPLCGKAPASGTKSEDLPFLRFHQPADPLDVRGEAK